MKAKLAVECGQRWWRPRSWRGATWRSLPGNPGVAFGPLMLLLGDPEAVVLEHNEFPRVFGVDLRTSMSTIEYPELTRHAVDLALAKLASDIERAGYVPESEPYVHVIVERMARHAE